MTDKEVEILKIKMRLLEIAAQFAGSANAVNEIYSQLAKLIHLDK